ncbi:MAG: amidinotransferase [Nitrospirae bacterium]|nr:MAG: amidinotransferase [Nitrospirota bacterium]
MIPARILMCPPVHYGIEYEINAWMDLDRPADRAEAWRQWRRLRQAVADLPGVEVVEIAPVAGLPDMVFTANGGLHVDRRVVVGTFRHPERRGETPHFARWFEAHGYEPVLPPEGLFLEGAGDVVRTARGWIAGYPQRSSASAHRWLARLLGEEVLSVELVDPRYYHLDTCLVVLGPESAACAPAAFDTYGLRVLRAAFPDLIEVEPEEGARFACNLVAWAGHAVLPAGCPRLAAALAERGWTTTEVPMGEFIKAGGAARCLCLTLPERGTVVDGLAP